MKIIIWLDDLRPIDEKILCFTGYDAIIIIKTYRSAVNILSKLHDAELYMSFDHDLGEEKSGYDIAKYIVENHIPLAGFEIHSQNIVGVRNIRELLTHYGYSENIPPNANSSMPSEGSLYAPDDDSYKPLCPIGCTDCISDPAYIRHYYPEWYAELGNPVTCDCANADGTCNHYDDEDK